MTSTVPDQTATDPTASNPTAKNPTAGNPTASGPADVEPTAIPARAEPRRGEGLQRTLAVIATAGMILAVVVNGVLDSDLPDDKATLLRDVGAHHARALTSVLAFAAIQVTSIGAFLGLARLLRPRSPRLGVIGALLTVIGAFGHTAYSGLTLMIMLMATDPAHASGYAALLTRMDSQPYIAVFALLGLVCVVAGTLVSSIGIFRAHLGPRWLAPLLWAWLLVEFVGSGFVAWLEYPAVLMAVVAWIMIIREMLRRR